MKDQNELSQLAMKVEGQVKERFPESPYTNTEAIMRAISLLEGRLINLFDMPDIAPYFFTEPDKSEILDPALAKEKEAYANTVRHAAVRFSRVSKQWDREEILDVIQKIGHEVEAVSSKLVMRILRQVITGMKEGPALVNIIHFIGRERTLERLGNPPPLSP